MTLSSTYKVQYDIRPAKQVERRILLDAFHRLALSGFDLSAYQYTGFGSIYFVDFVLMHKILGLTDLLSLERDPSLTSRVKFNRPYKCVRTEMESASEQIPKLSREKRHIVWLDYDGLLHRDHIADIRSALALLSPGSILLVTIDAEPPREEDFAGILEEPLPRPTPKHWKEYFRYHASDYLDVGMRTEDFSKASLAKTNVRILSAVFRSAIASRRGVKFKPLFNFQYKDGHLMVSVGGMIATPSDVRKIQSSTLRRTNYYRNSFDKPPFVINIPRLTRKERAYLDREMPCRANWIPTDFVLQAEDVAHYREIYRFMPAYGELLL